MIYLSSPVINKRKNTVRFQINNKVARQIVLSGSFNGWAKNQFLMRKHADGSWSVEIPLPPQRKISVQVPYRWLHGNGRH